MLEVLRAEGPVTRRELLELVPLSRSTLLERLETLQALSLVRYGARGRAATGRPPDLLEFDDASRRVLAVDLGAVHAVLALTNLSARRLVVQTIPTDLTGEPHRVLAAVIEAAGRLVAEHGGGAEGLLGVALSFPGLTARVPGTIEAPAVLAHWDGVPAGPAFQRALGAPALLVNDAHAMAYGEHLADGRRRTLLAVKVATGIGAGLVVDGRLHIGDSHGAGQFGHMRVPALTQRCTCGQDGCLATVASGRALLRQLGPFGLASLDDIVEAAKSGHHETVAALARAGEAVGVVISGVATMIDPGAILFGGQLGPLPPFLDAVRRAIESLTYARTARGIHIGATVLGQESGVTGLAALTIDKLLDARAVDTMVAEAAMRPRAYLGGTSAGRVSNHRSTASS